MKVLVENWQGYLNEKEELKIFKVKAKVGVSLDPSIEGEHIRTQIRGIEGITVVNPKETGKALGGEFIIIEFKFLLKGLSLGGFFRKIKQEIRSLDGTTTIKFVEWERVK